MWMQTFSIVESNRIVHIDCILTRPYVLINLTPARTDQRRLVRLLFI